MTDDDVKGVIKLIEEADLIMLVVGDKKAAFGPDIVDLIVSALRLWIKERT